jgi:hypothetical protein
VYWNTPHCNDFVGNQGFQCGVLGVLFTLHLTEYTKCNDGVKKHQFFLHFSDFEKHCSIVKNLLPILKNQNGVSIQDGVENVYIFHPIFSKMIFWSIILLFFYNLGKNNTSMGKLFLENSKWRNSLICKMIFFKKFQDFIIAQPLNEMF